MKQCLVDVLQCPFCGGGLKWSVTKSRKCESSSLCRDIQWIGLYQNPSWDETQEDIVQADALCETCGIPYQVRDGIGVFQTPNLPTEDPREGLGSHLHWYLEEHPDVDSRLTQSPLESLSAADKFFRGLVLSERKDFSGAQRSFYEADREIYTPEYNGGLDSQVHHLLEAIGVIRSQRLSSDRRGLLFKEPLGLSEAEKSALRKLKRQDSIIVDLASGRGGLAKAILRAFPDTEVVVSDFSSRALKVDQAELSYLGLQANADFISFDARKMPFKTCSIPIITTLFGLQCISQIEPALEEIRRVLSGYMLAICLFNAEDDEETRSALHDRALEGMAYESSAVQALHDAGFEVEVQNRLFVPAKPTPKSVLLGGIGIDAFPLKETFLEWCTLAIW